MRKVSGEEVSGGGGFQAGEGFRVKRVFGGSLQDIFVRAISRVSHGTPPIQCLNKPSSIVTSFSAQLPQPLQPRHRSPSGVLSLLLGCLFHITKEEFIPGRCCCRGRWGHAPTCDFSRRSPSGGTTIARISTPLIGRKPPAEDRASLQRGPLSRSPLFFRAPLAVRWVTSA